MTKNIRLLCGDCLDMIKNRNSFLLRSGLKMKRKEKQNSTSAWGKRSGNGFLILD